MKTKAIKTKKTATKKTKQIVVNVKSIDQNDVATGQTEAGAEVICADIDSANQQAQGVSPENVVSSMPLVEIEIADELTTCVKTWNANSENTVPSIVLRENSNVLNRFEYIPATLSVGNRKSKFSILQCSDNGAQVGKPFADSYGLLNNSDFIGVVESIGGALDKLGLKWKVSTTGTLFNRERSFISLEIAHEQTEIIDGREFQAFLNCLNSIPSNSGCTVTFANNTFCVCCKNTFAHVLHGRDNAKFHAALKHTPGLKACLKDIPVLVEAYFSGNKELFKNLKSFSVFPVSLIEAEQFFSGFIGRDLKGNLTDKTELTTRSGNIIEKLKELFVTGKGNKGQTALDVFQAVTEFYTHFSAGKSEDAMKQIESSEAGSGYNSKNEFYQWLIAATQTPTKWTDIARVGDTLLMAYRNKAKK